MQIDPQLDLMAVTGKHIAEVEADGAELFLSVNGSQFFGGNAALTKAQELASLNTALKAIGLTEKDILIDDVRMDQGGVFGKSSSVRYRIKVICRTLKLVSEALNVLTHQKQVSLDETIWVFSNEDSLRDGWLKIASQNARASAQLLSETHDLILSSVHRIFEGQPERKEYGTQSYFSGSQMAFKAFADLGAPETPEVGHTKAITTLVTIVYKIMRKDDAPV